MITSTDMKHLENLSEKYGVSKLELMENAGKGIFQIVKKKFDLNDKKILVVTYHGNNGGDGFVAARYFNSVSKVTILFLGEENKLKNEGKINFDIIKHDINRNFNEFFNFFTDFSKIDFNNYDIIIDAILGTGISGKIKEPIASVIDLINKSDAYKVSVDIPTGINPDTGEVLDKAIKPNLVIVFHDIKKGLLSYLLSTIIVDIGIPRRAIQEFNEIHKKS